MSRIGALLLVLISLVAPSSTTPAQELLDSSTDELIAQEEVRSAVETAIENYLGASGGDRIEATFEGIRSLIPYGEKAVPYLANELEQEAHRTYDFVAYALGLFEYPAAETALREAIERAEATRGTAAMARKGWSCWALGLHGEIDALTLVNEGEHQSAAYAIHRETTVLEAIALQTAPESVQVLLQQLDSWGDDEDKRGDLRFVLRALRRLGDPASTPKLIEIIEQKENDPGFRALATGALRAIETPRSVAALVSALQDPAPKVRRVAAFALKWMDQPVDVTKLLEFLAVEDDLRVREALYGIIASQVQPEQIPEFLELWNRPSPEDRRFFLIALPRVENQATLSVLSAAVDDPSEQLAMLAIGPLVGSGGKAGADRLQEILASTDRWGVVREIAKAAGANGMKKLAPSLTQKLLEAVQLDATTHRGLRSAAKRLAEALVDLRYTSALSKLRRAREPLNDPELVEVLDGVIDSLDLLRANGKEVAKWAPLLKDPDSTRSRLARRRLAELGGEQSATALLEGYDDLDILARIDTLQNLEELDFPAVRSLLRRLLVEPESYTADRGGERVTAAWIVRRFGGEEMLKLLIEAVRLREGRDADTLIYAAALGRDKVLPLLREYRLSRLRLLGTNRGYEQEVLDWIIRRLENDLPIERYDQPPIQLVIR